MGPATRFAGAWRRPGCAALAILAGCMLCATAAAARIDLVSRTDALQTAVSRTPVTSRTIDAVADYPLFATSSTDPAGAIDRETARLHDVLAPTLPVQASSRDWAELVAPPAGLANPPAAAVASRGTPPQVTVDYRQNLAAHATLIAGHWPDRATTSSLGTTTLEVALTPATLARLDARLGSVFSLGDHGLLTVVGIVAPMDPAEAFWQSRPDLAAPVFDQPGLTPPYWDIGVLIGSGEIDALPGMFEIGDLELSWTAPLNATGYTPGGVSALFSALTAGLSADALALYGDTGAGGSLGIGLELSSGFAPTVQRFILAQNTEEVATAIPTTSLIVIGLIAVALLGRASADRREPESRLLLARGAPARELLGRTLTDSVLTIVPVFAAAIGLAAVVPGTVPADLWWRLALIGAAAMLAPSAVTLVRHRPARRRARPELSGNGLRRRVRNGNRRTVLTGAAGVLCVAGLEQVRTHGLAAGGGVDFYTACAPLLASTLATIATLALGPAVLRLLLPWARRGRGAILLLGLGRIARHRAPAAVSVFILTLALSTADLTLALLRASHDTAATTATAQPAATYLKVLTVAALAAGCLIVALAAFGDAARHRAGTARLTVTGMTAGQAFGVAVVELSAPILLAVLGGSAAACALPWPVRPALAEVLGGGVRLTPALLAAPPSALIPLALAAGLIGAALARRGAAAALRLGDQAEGD